MTTNPMLKLASSMSLIAITLSACGGEFSYKRGASVQDFQSQKQICAGSEKSEATIQQCLEENGWIVLDGDNKQSLRDRQLNTVTTTYTKASADPFAVEKQAPTETAPTVTETDPLARIQVSSWWKMGASAEQLIIEGQACLTELGDAYYANGNMSEVSLGVAFCMEDKGWRVMLPK